MAQAVMTTMAAAMTRGVTMYSVSVATEAEALEHGAGAAEPKAHAGRGDVDHSLHFGQQHDIVHGIKLGYDL
eukprot:6504748-Prymnesium_polylepis.1